MDQGKVLVAFNGTPRTRKYFNEFLTLPNKFPYEPELSLDPRGWIIRQEDVRIVETIEERLFPNKKKTMKEKMSGLVKAQKKQVTGWESIGTGMKLQLYDYQKQIVKFVVDSHGDNAHDTLIIAPCGSGKYSA